MIWFSLGAILAVAQTFIRYPDTLRQPHWVQGLLFTVAMGTAVYGTILWAIVTYVF